MTSPIDRAALADALASASTETLREDAEICRSALAHAGNDRTAASLQRLAALALAVAAMQERGAFVATDLQAWTVATDATESESATIYTRPTLPAALAALLKGDQ